MSFVHRGATCWHFAYTIFFLLILGTSCTPSSDKELLEEITISPTKTAAPTMIIPTPDQVIVVERTPRPTMTPKPVTIRSINVQTDEKAAIVSRPDFRPIPTVDTNALNSAQNVFAATVAPTADTPLFEPIGKQMTRSELNTKIDLARQEIRNVAFILETSKETNAINCQEMTRSYDLIFENSSTVSVPPELDFVYENYDLAVNTFAVELVSINRSCRAFAEDPAQQATYVLVESFDPQALVSDAMEQSAVALRYIYDAQLWLSADESRTLPLYTEFRDRLNVYSSLLETATVAECAELSRQYHQINAEIRPLSPPVGYRYDAYQLYLEAAREFEEGGMVLIAYCDQLPEAALVEEPSTLPADLFTASMAGSELALAFINRALFTKPASVATLHPTLTASSVAAAPVAERAALTSNSSITARLVRVQPSNATHLYEIVLDITIKSNKTPFQVFIGGFRMNPDTNQLIITLQCDREFQDRVILIDGSGTTHTSNIVSASRGDACPRWGESNWATATPHPTLTPKPQPTKYPTRAIPTLRPQPTKYPTRSSWTAP